MPVQFGVAKRKDPSDDSAPVLYYPVAQSTGRADEDAIAQIISDISTVSVVDTAAVIRAFLKVVPEQLAEGNIVELGNFGSFRLSLSGIGVETPDEVTAAEITEKKVIFTPGKNFKKVLKTIEFRKEKLPQPEPEPQPQP